MSYGKKQVLAKARRLKAGTTHRYHKLQVIGFRLFMVVILLCIIWGISAGMGVLNGLLKTAPSINSINVVPDGYTTNILNKKGEIVETLIGSDANREYVELKEIPTHLQNAFVAIEDERFWEHDGIDLHGIFRAAFVGVKGGDFSQGASTLTQQLLKNQVFNGGEENTLIQRVERKVQEQYLAIQLENKLSKKQIMEYYLNTINLGQNTLGVQAASKRYFNKKVSNLTISESAVIAGITQNPSLYNPISHPQKNKEKRAIILAYMLEQGYITSDEYNEAIKDKVYQRIKSVNKETMLSSKPTTYFTDALIDQIIRDMKQELGYTETQAYNALYRGGLTIYSTQNASMQKIVDSVINNNGYYPGGIYQLSYQLTVRTEDGKSINYGLETMKSWFKKKRHQKISSYYTSKSTAKKYIKIYRKAMTKKATVEGENIQFTLEPQSSFVLMDQETGQVKAISGGRGEKLASRTLNRAESSLRQPGSTFKVLSTYVPALDSAGMTLATVEQDSPFKYPGTDRYVKNWYSGYKGATTIRKAIAMSMNVIAVKTLQKVTPRVGYEYLVKMGLTSLVDNYTASNGKVYSDIALPMALGGLTKGVTNLELTTAFASIANGGVYNKATFYTKVVDHNGNVILDRSPKTTEERSGDKMIKTITTPTSNRVMKDSTAFLLTSAMEDVVKSGTGTAIKFNSLNMPVAGKTGTTTNNKDIWFVGYTPYLTAGIWAGYDNTLRQGNTTYHKTMWKTIMERINKRYPKKGFTKPASVIKTNVCSVCGKRIPQGRYGYHAVNEYFAKSSLPNGYCYSH